MRASYERAAAGAGARPRRPGAEAPLDTEEHLAELVLSADPEALADLRAQALEPLASLPPGHRATGSPRRCGPGCCTRAGATTSPPTCFVHPQTVRYRMGQLRELYGDRLTDPAVVRGLVIALTAGGVARR